MNICTIIARNYAAHARVLAESFLEHHPDGTCSVLVIDDPTGFLNADEEPFELLTIEEIGLPDAAMMAAIYDVMELSTAVKPWLMRHLLDRPGVEAVTYLDPDIRVFASLEEVDRRAREHEVVLTPHFTDPLPRDGLKPGEEDILIAGSYNLGFIALGAGETSHALLDWWAERLERDCVNEPEQGRFVDQRWIDLAPGLWPGIDVLRDTTYNIAYWNLATRSLEADGEGYGVDGSPLRFFHFSGFDPRDPTELSKHQNRIRVDEDPALTRICAEYASELFSHGFEQAIEWPYGWGAMPGGIVLDRAARLVFREAVEAGVLTESAFAEPGATRLVQYLRGQSRSERAGDGLNRYARALWDTRADFRKLFPNIDGDSGPPFVTWLHVSAADTGVSVDLLPPPRFHGSHRALRSSPPSPGMNVVGYLSSERGVGEAARQVVSALRGRDLPLAEIDTPTVPSEIADSLGGLPEGDHPYDFNLLCINADMLPVVATALGRRFFEGRHSTGLWFWEVSHFPEQWLRSFDYVDEVWVASEHVADALRPLTSRPVHTIRLPVLPEAPVEASRAQLGMPEGFCFLFVFDYRSVFRRKNPLGLIEAFRKAFEPGEGPSLVIKSICGDEFPAEREELASAAAQRPDIHLIEDTVTIGEKNAMIASCDCYVSLHRSEGLGLTMAEAMYFGRPVIATSYSGNLDFMTERNSYLVPHGMVAIGPGANPYPEDKAWADPDLDAAARMMREAFEDPEAAAARGRLAAEDIRRTHSPDAAAEAITVRMEEIRRRRLIDRLRGPTTADAAAGSSSGRLQLEHLLALSEPPPKGGAGGLRASAKRIYMRMLRPYAAHQTRINESLAESLDEVREILRETLRIDVENDEKLRELERRVSRQREE